MRVHPDEVLAMAVFARVVEAQSFTGAAARTGLSKSAVSARVAQLEERLGVRLLNRTTRRISLTEAGAELYKRAARIVADADEARETVTGLGSSMGGVLRVNVPSVLGMAHVVPAARAFLAANPSVSLDLTAEDRFVDAMHAGYDVVIRIASTARMRDSSVTAKKIGSDEPVVCASAEYLEQMGEPRTPEDLIRHRCLRYSNNALHDEWRFKRADQRAWVPVTGPFATNSGVMLVEALRAGAGIGVVPSFMVRDAIAQGSLVRLLDGYRGAPLGIYALTPSRRIPAKARVFIDALARRLRESGLGP